MSDTRYLATNLRAVLEAQDRTAVWLAKKTRTSRSLMGYIVNGERTASHEVASSVSDILGVPLFLMFDVTEVTQNAETVAA